MEQNISWYSTTATNPITSTPINQGSSSNINWTTPRASKRSISESDNDDLYSEESSKEHSSSIENDSCQLMSRKKRRGVIEKKRRDRINASLSELKRLVPSAFEKQGSAKLEKAEILQMTVEHLKLLNSKGIDSLSYDPQRFAMEYHIIGFRECASEVARYLVTIEGMDIQDPMRLRLMSHLQCFISQRELSAKSSMGVTLCNSGVNSYNPSVSYGGANIPAQNNSNSYHQNLSNASSYPNYFSHFSSDYINVEQTVHTNNTSTANGSSISAISASRMGHPQQEHTQPIYTELTNINEKAHYEYNNANQQFSNTTNSNNSGYNLSVKPYRPWHPDTMAY